MKSKKSSKIVAKNILSSPFAVLGPINIDSGSQELIQKHFDEFKFNLSKPKGYANWKHLQKFKKGEERKAEILRLEKEYLDSLEPEMRLENEKIEKSKQVVILGYNSIMRSLEKDQIAFVLLNEEKMQTLLCSALMTACQARNVPFSAISGLQNVYKNACAMALKISVEKTPWNSIYEILKKSQKMSPTKENIPGKSSIRKTKTAPVDNKIDISKYHLRKQSDGNLTYTPKNLPVESNLPTCKAFDGLWEDYVAVSPTNTNNPNTKLYTPGIVNRYYLNPDRNK